MRTVLIYALVDPRNGLSRYVGKTMGTLRDRLRTHLNDVRRGRVYIPRHRWMAELLAEGLAPTIRQIDQTTEDLWQQCERSWIAKMKADGCDLLNATAGGDGLSSYKHRQDTILKQSESALARYVDNAERVKSSAAVQAALARPESKSRLREAAMKKDPAILRRMIAGGTRYARSVEARQATSARFKGRKWSAAQRAHFSAIKMGKPRTAASIQKQRQTLAAKNARVAVNA